MSYFDALRDDFSALGLDPQTEEVLDYFQLHELLQCTRQLGPDGFSSEAKRTVSTELGKFILSMEGALPVFEDEYNLYECCSAAELKLLANISTESVENSDWHSPLIFTQRHVPVAVSKGYGETTCYALQTDTKLGLVEGTFCYDFSLPNARYDLDTSPFPYWYELPHTAHFKPIRFSAFAVPPIERINLDQFTEATILETSHEDILLRADKLFDDAVDAKDFVAPIGKSRMPWMPSKAAV